VRSSKLYASVTLLAAFAVASAAAAEGTAAAGQAKSATCIACHGADGNSVNPEWPSLAGQHASYIERQLHLFKSGARQNVLMSPMTMTLSDEDIADLAAYYAGLNRTGLEADPAKVEQGTKLYRGGDAKGHVAACIACHGPTGSGNPAVVYPALRAQHAAYVAAQLRAYRSGERTTDPNQMMRNVAAGLSDAEIDAVASYLQGLR
jgi:cytochrome c553